MGHTIDIPEVAKQGEWNQDEDIRATKEEVLMPLVHSIYSLLENILDLTFHLALYQSLVGQYQQSYATHHKYRDERDRYK